jgi:ATP-dependent Clp protease ATP-binding subunit ClpA
LIGHFVDQARRSGASWTDIGRSMGVSKQAAQKRFVTKSGDAAVDATQGFGRFTQRAKNVVVAAQNEAQKAGNPEIRVEHLLLGLLAEPDAVAAKALVARGVSLPDLRAAVMAVLPDRQADVPALIPYDDGARKALELTFREALRLGHNYVGTEHILLALMEVGDSVGLLTTSGLAKSDLETEIAAALAIAAT